MKKVLFLILFGIFSAFAEKIVTIEGEASYTHSDNESKIDARKEAIGLAGRDAVEKFATMITSTTVVENYEMKKDRVVANSCAMMRNVLYLTDEYDKANGIYHIKLKAEIDEDEVMKLLKEKQSTSDHSAKITDFVLSGMKAERDLRIGDALRYYYWSYLLIKADELNKDMKMDEFDKRQLATALPERMNKLFTQLEIKVKTIREDNGTKCVVLGIQYHNQPVSGMDITYYTGDSWSSYIKARNGLAQIDFFGHSATTINRLQIKTEYRYDNLIRHDDDMTKVLEKISHIPFPDSSYPPIPLIVEEEPEQVKETESTVVEIEKDVHFEAVSHILETINNKKYHEAKNLFTPEAYQAFNDLIMYGNASILVCDTELKKYKLNDQTVVRSVPMSFSFPRNDTKFTENVVFTFNKDNLIDAITFSLSDRAASDIINKPESFGTDEDKIQLIQFMELYKTAYCLKQINYIESIFADNALIIVGRMLRPDEKIGEMDGMFETGKRVKYDKMGKKEYINRLKMAFNSNEFININFEENTVEKKNKQKIYSLEIKQFYNSTNYSDEGYLFLLMDLRNIKEPKIYVRAWQPDSMKVADRLKLSDFKISF
ncbi:MAG: hypothetical protein RBS89_03675 [Candidatus Delongbacteria bacterium]|jgi:hypothetical protein|nr:hypothetical protein [Candidatus Delongbacteria bacterium]